MNTDNLESRIIDYIDGKGTEAERAAMEKELTAHKDAFALYEQLKEVITAIDATKPLQPSEKLKANFEQLLQKEIESQKKDNVRALSPLVYRIAAALLLVIAGVAIGNWINKSRLQEQEIAKLQQQVEETRKMMMVMLENQQSASQRMMGLSVAYDMEKPDDKIVDVLVKTMNEDPNTNVRLAALDALGKFHTEATVRTALIHSLSIQKDPVVQIALIKLMVTLKEKSIVNQLEQMTKDAGTMKAVKDEAYFGILKLS